MAFSVGRADGRALPLIVVSVTPTVNSLLLAVLLLTPEVIGVTLEPDHLDVPTTT